MGRGEKHVLLQTGQRQARARFHDRDRTDPLSPTDALVLDASGDVEMTCRALDDLLYSPQDD